MDTILLLTFFISNLLRILYVSRKKNKEQTSEIYMKVYIRILHDYGII